MPLNIVLAAFSQYRENMRMEVGNRLYYASRFEKGYLTGEDSDAIFGVNRYVKSERVTGSIEFTELVTGEGKQPHTITIEWT